MLLLFIRYTQLSTILQFPLLAKKYFSNIFFFLCVSGAPHTPNHSLKWTLLYIQRHCIGKWVFSEFLVVHFHPSANHALTHILSVGMLLFNHPAFLLLYLTSQNPSILKYLLTTFCFQLLNLHLQSKSIA